MEDEVMSSVANKVKTAGQSHATELILFPLFIITIVGMIANNFTASGINVVPVLPATCTDSNGNPWPLCYPTNTTGCGTSVSNCNITSATTFSFLNPNSPFTFLIQGNVLGFLTQLLTNGEAQNTYYSGATLCIPQQPISQSLYNATGTLIQGFQCYGRVTTGQGNLSNPLIFPVINATSNNGNSSVWTLLGCPYLHVNVSLPHCGVSYTGPNAQWQQITENAFYIRNGTTLTTGQCTVFGVTYSTCGVFWRAFAGQGTATFQCPNTASLHAFGSNKTIVISQTTYYCLIPFNTPTNTSIASVMGFWGFIAGIVLLIIGMGINLGWTGQVLATGVGFSMGSNAQGSRQATILGMFIMMWSFLFSEFGSWTTSLFFGLGTIFFIALAAVSFMGIYWRMFSWE